jgi:serine/threonine-protein kinase RsbW
MADNVGRTDAPDMPGVPAGASLVSLPPELAALDRLAAFVDDACRVCAAPGPVRLDAQLALEELFVNVADHGFPDGRPRADVWLAAWSQLADEACELHFVMSDAGVPYDVLAHRPQRVQARLGADNKVGGLGILLVRERMDAVSYERRDGRNVLSLVKRFAPAGR